MIIVVMGVAGSGKTTIGKLLSDQLSLPFFDGDHFHPEENKRKMGSGIPLNDEDREPWLKKLASLLGEQQQQGGCVLACSALKEKYRKLLQEGTPEKIEWIHLEGPFDLLYDRLKQRVDHFMPPSLLESQLKTLEIPSYAHRFSITLSPEELLPAILKKIGDAKKDDKTNQETQ